MTLSPPHPEVGDDLVHAERIILGAMMNSTADVVLDCAARLSSEDFYRPQHSMVFTAICDLWARELPTDPAAVYAELTRRAATDRASRTYGVEAIYLTDCLGAVPSLTSLGVYLDKVADAAYRRRVTEALATGAGQIGAGADINEIADRIRATLAEHGPVARRTGRRARITWAADIDPEPVVWAWTETGEGRIPAGALSVAAGREGTGKSSFGIWLTAQISQGTLPGAFYGTPRATLYVAVEDSWKHTLVPRLMAAGADRSRVGRFDVVRDLDTELTLSLPIDNDLLEAEILRHQIALVVIDPLLSAIGEGIDSHRNREVRTALDPLAAIADRTGAIILGIAHFNKGHGTDAASLISGSGAFKDVPRTVFGFARDDAEEGNRVMSQVKNSLGRDDLPSLSYAIESAAINTGHGITEVGRFAFTGTSERSVADVLGSAGPSDPAERAERAEAAEWLRDYLMRQGGEALVSDLLRAGRADGFSEDRLKRAKSKARVRSDKAAFHTGWVWRIITESDSEPSLGAGTSAAAEGRGTEGSAQGSEGRTEEGEARRAQKRAPFAPFALFEGSGAAEAPSGAQTTLPHGEHGESSKTVESVE